jgi:hypothetical protein
VKHRKHKIVDEIDLKGKKKKSKKEEIQNKKKYDVGHE